VALHERLLVLAAGARRQRGRLVVGVDRRAAVQLIERRRAGR
jgi:hypothetical protein